MPRLIAHLSIPFTSRNREGKLGQSLVEFALVLPILTLLIVGTLDLGRAYFAYMSIVNAAREGARYGAANPPLNAALTNPIIAQAKNEVDPNLINVSNLTVTATCDPDCSRTGAVVVSVSYPFRLITSVLFGAGTVQLRATDQMEIFAGQ